MTNAECWIASLRFCLTGLLIHCSTRIIESGGFKREKGTLEISYYNNIFHEETKSRVYSNLLKLTSLIIGKIETRILVGLPIQVLFSRSCLMCFSYFFHNACGPPSVFKATHMPPIGSFSQSPQLQVRSPEINFSLSLTPQITNLNRMWKEKGIVFMQRDI